MERYRFLLSDGVAFQYLGEGAFARAQEAEAHAIQVAQELSEDDTWHGGWIPVMNSQGHEVVRGPIGVRGTLIRSDGPSLFEGKS